MNEDNRELKNIVDADDINLGWKIARMKTGLVLFFSTCSPGFQNALRLISRLARENDTLNFVRVLVEEEERDSSKRIVAPGIWKSLREKRFPQWMVFQDGKIGATIISKEDRESQLADVCNLFRGIGIEIK